MRFHGGEDSLMCYCAEMNSFRGNVDERILSLNVRKCIRSSYPVIELQGILFLRIAGCLISAFKKHTTLGTLCHATFMSCLRSDVKTYLPPT